MLEGLPYHVRRTYQQGYQRRPVLTNVWVFYVQDFYINESIQEAMFVRGTQAAAHKPALWSVRLKPL
jgi:hypothetical protein